MTDTVQQFCELFQGNASAIGLEVGGAHRLREGDTLAEEIEMHLTGRGDPIGVYPMVGHSTWNDMTWKVHWGCIDFDEGEQESWLHAKNVHLALQTFGVSGWIERSRSKGYHVWVFLQQWTEAWLVRRALLAACQIVEAPTKEINPKQESLEEGQLGNYVRLPYPGALGGKATLTLGRRVMVAGNGEPVHLDGFVKLAHVQRTDVAALEKLASYWKPPAKPLRTRNWDSLPFDGEAVDRLVGKARMIWEDGPLEGSDRSDTLYKLAMYLKEDGRHTREEAFDLLVDADARWGKFSDRPDRDQRLDDLLDKAGF